MSESQLSKEELLLQRAAINAQIAAIDPNSIAFSVDANIINRLGKELVGRAETAVSELVKNAYDADSTSVEVDFIDTNSLTGKIRIKDNGLGMDRASLIKGFMRLSSPDKLLNPISPVFKRRRAGQKGIGRFATQRLGGKLTILTRKSDSETGLKIIIDWNRYGINQELESVEHQIEDRQVDLDVGTTLIIENLREQWSLAAIKRIYRYVSELLQPSYDASFKDSSFDVKFKFIQGNEEYVIADSDNMIFDRAVAIICGKVDKLGNGSLSVRSAKFEIDEDISIPKSDEQQSYNFIKNIEFKTFYFIYNRPDYYDFDYTFTRLEYNKLTEIADTNAGVRLYRNGFRVLPYGERFDDWLRLDERYSASSGTNIPFGTKNLFGYVSIPDSENELFEETSSREGLIENDAFIELVAFVQAALRTARRFISESEGLYKARQQRKENEEKARKKTKRERFKRLKDEFAKGGRADLAKEVDELESETESVEKELLNELAMLRVLATLGLTIGEFGHEIRQFKQWFDADLILLSQRSGDFDNILRRLRKRFDYFSSYTAYFDTAISRNTQRELSPQNLNSVVDSFLTSVSKGIEDNGISVESETYGTKLYTCPMHYSEWHSILLNLYTNSLKAIKRAKPKTKKIKIVVGKEKEEVYLEFSDNGDGIKDDDKDRVYNAFFTRSIAYDTSHGHEDLIGTGLGLFIVKNIIVAYNGNINVIPAETGYNTCFRIELPMATEAQLIEYDI